MTTEGATDPPPASPSSTAEPTPPSDGEGLTGKGRFRAREAIALAVGLTAYAVLIAELSNLRAQNFFTSAWDLGINQQLLWTTAHGRLLYETADLEFYGAHSFLQVHSTYLAFAVAPLYAAWPTPMTLFAVQAAAFALSGVPLYFLARRTLQRWESTVAILVLYFASFGVLAALMYDFHWESFIPAEFLTFYVLVSQRRFVLALVPFTLGTVTLEVFPFLAGGVLVLALYERAQALGFRWRAVGRDRQCLVLGGLVLVALIAYALVRFFQLFVVPSLLGVPSVSGGGPSGISAVIGFAANTTTLPHSLAYWGLLLCTLGALPLLTPRYLILSIPWFFYSVIVSPVFSSYFGGAQALIAMPALVVAAVYGLRALERLDWGERRSMALVGGALTCLVALTLVAVLPEGSVHLLRYTAGPEFWLPTGLLVLAVVSLAYLLRRAPTKSPPNPRPSHRLQPYAAPGLLAGVVVSILVLDTVLSPFNPSNFAATPIPGYEFQFGTNPSAAEMPWVVHFLPSDAEVLASDRLFPYVANNPNAWPVPWFVISPSSPVPYFPFTPSNLPEYVLADAQEFSLIPAFLQVDLFNASVYGLVAYLYAPSAPGTIYVFEQGFQGTPTVRDIAPAQTTFVFTANNLSIGSSGAVATDAASSYGRVIRSEATGPVAGLLAPIWYGPYRTFLPGNYTVTYSLSGMVTNHSSGSTVVGDVDATWQGAENISSFFREPVNASDLSPAGWTNLTFSFELRYPYPMVEFRGFLALYGGRSIGTISLNTITVVADPA